MFLKKYTETIGKLSLFMAGAVVLSVPFSVYAETLEQAVATTLSQHPQVDSATAALRGAEQRQKEEFSAYFPTLEVNAQAGRIFGDNSTSRGLNVTRGSGYSGLAEGSVSARQKIYDGFETQNRVRSARADKEAAELSLMDVRESLALRAVQTYTNLLRVGQGLAMLRGQDKSVKDYLSRIETLVDDGVADEAELQQALDVSVILDNFIVDYEGQLQTLRSDLFELTGYLPESALETPTVPHDEIPGSISDAVVQAKDAHPLLRSAALQSQASKHNVQAEKSTYVPKVDGELFYLKNDREDVIGGEVEDARAVLRMNWGFEIGGAQKARIQQRTFEHKQSMAREAELARQIERDVRQAYTELNTAQKLLENQKRRFELNEKLLDTYKTQFEGARISLLQLMQSDNQVLLTKLETSNAQSRVLLARYGILAAMGRLQNSLDLEVAAVSHPRHTPN